MLSLKGLAYLSVLGTLVVLSSAIETSTTSLWSKFETTRQSPRSLHQEFEVTRRVNSGYVQQVSHHQITVDFSQGRWREQSLGGAGDLTRIFDSQDIF